MQTKNDDIAELKSDLDTLKNTQPVYFAVQGDKIDKAVAEFLNGYRNRELPMALKRE